MFLRSVNRESERLARYAGLVVSLVLHGHSSNERLKGMYATKFYHNIMNGLLVDLPGCLVVLYYDESTSLELLELLEPVEAVVLVYVQQAPPSTSIMLARFLEFDKARPGRKWCFTFDGHEEMHNIARVDSKRRLEQHAAVGSSNWRRMVDTCLECELLAGALYWDHSDVTASDLRPGHSGTHMHAHTHLMYWDHSVT